MKEEKKYLEEVFYEPLTGEEMGIYIDDAKMLSVEDLDRLIDIFRDERSSPRRYKNLSNQVVNHEINRIINIAQSLEEFIIMWKGFPYAADVDENQLRGFWEQFMEGKAGDTPNE